MIWIDGRPRTRGGYLDMGPITIPPLATRIILTDRDDGTHWFLSYNTDTLAADGFGYVSINTTWPNQPDVRTYAAYEEPYLAEEPRARIIVRGGYLGYEYLLLTQGITDQDQQRVLARKGNITTYYEIIKPTGWKAPPTGPVITSDTLGYSPVDLS